VTTYRKKKGKDTWHWCKNCSNWPTSDYDEQTLPGKTRPSTGELDNECLSKEDKGTCTQ
jgi:hypothetical protein